MVLSSEAGIVAVPLLLPDAFPHGPQSATTTSPLLPIAPRWMCAAVAGPVSFPHVSFQVSFVPDSVPVYVPWAALALTACFGISWPALSVVLSRKCAAAGRADENAAKTSAATAPAARIETSFF